MEKNPHKENIQGGRPLHDLWQNPTQPAGSAQRFGFHWFCGFHGLIACSPEIALREAIAASHRHLAQVLETEGGGRERGEAGAARAQNRPWNLELEHRSPSIGVPVIAKSRKPSRGGHMEDTKKNMRMS